MENSTRLYSVYDKGAELFGPLFDAINDATASRAFILMMKKVQEEFRVDYLLFFMGTYNIKTGEIIPETPFKINIRS